MAYILRHNPENLEMDSEGYVLVSSLCKYLKISRRQLEEIVSDNDKQRFAFSTDFRKIRASQGHSIPVRIEYKQEIPPEYLFHGTSTKSLDGIMKEGILPKNRNFVHLSWDIETATNVGSRHGKPVILRIQSLAMHESGISFFLSDNNVWLVKEVPTNFLEFHYATTYEE